MYRAQDLPRPEPVTRPQPTPVFIRPVHIHMQQPTRQNTEPLLQLPPIVNIRMEQPPQEQQLPPPSAEPPVINLVVQPPAQAEREKNNASTVEEIGSGSSPTVEQKQFGGPNKNNSPDEQKMVQPPNEINSTGEQKTIQPANENNSETIQGGELFEPVAPTPQVDVPAFKKVGKVGRQRRYETLGIDDIEPIKELVLFRHQMGRHWPGLSKDMEAYYERNYFTKPKRGSDATHKKCWERRERWLAQTESA